MARRKRSTRLAAIIVAVGLIGAACGKGEHPQRMSGQVGPVSAATTRAASSSPHPTANLHWQSFRYDASQGNDTGTMVTLNAPKWQETEKPKVHDFRSGQLLFRLQFQGSTGSAIENWQAEAIAFAQQYPGYKLANMHSVDCPDGALDCADWEFTFPIGGVTRHVFDRGIVVNDSLRFAVYASGPESQLAEVKQIFQNAVRSIKFSVT